METVMATILGVIAGMILGYFSHVLLMCHMENHEETFYEYIPDFYEVDDWK